MRAGSIALALLVVAVGGFVAYVVLSGVEREGDATVPEDDALPPPERLEVEPTLAPPPPPEEPAEEADAGRTDEREGAETGAEPTPPPRPPERGNELGEARRPPPPPVDEAPRTGSLAGRVIFAGEPPPERPALVVDPTCCDAVDTSDRSIVIGPDRGVADAVVELEGAPAESPDDAADVEAQVTIECCRFSRRVAAVPAGGRVVLDNRDGREHPVRAIGRNPVDPLDLGPGEEAVIELPIPDRMELRDDAHPWMQAWVVVSESLHTAVTGSDGAFRLDGIPEGAWTVSAWHAELGSASETVAIVPGETAEVVIELGF